jgi:hypothetical protein
MCGSHELAQPFTVVMMDLRGWRFGAGDNGGA